MHILVHTTLKNWPFWDLHEGIDGCALRYHPDVGVMLQHLLGNVSSNGHDRHIGRLALGQLTDGGMP